MADQDQSQVISDTIPLSALVSQINSSQVSAQRTADRYARSGALDVCRFDDGYQTQLVFACQTCRTSVSHGFCLACSMHCHLDHDVVETGRKRHFRCDCGTERLPRPCQLTKKPEGTINQENRYNQNFMGLFCHCSKPYDPDTESKDVIMCCRCEDWFHDDLNCIGEAAGQKQSQGLYVCANCVQQAPLLASYCNAASSTESTDSWETSCSKPPSVTPGQHGIYLSSDITSRICRCDECLRVIADEKIEFLVEDESPDDDGEDDDDECPEQELKPEFNSEYILERALSRLPREMAIEGALRFRKFTDSIILGLKQITANDKDKIITADDVNAICESVLGKRSRGDDDS